MKKLLLTLALAGTMMAAYAQKPDADMQKAVDKALAATQDAKKSLKPASWMNLGKAYMAAYNAILKAQSTDGAAIRDALAGLEVKDLVTGDLRFDENGDAVKNYVAIKTFQDGSIVFSDAYTG